MATDKTLPQTMRAWQFSSTKGGLENNLKLENNVAVPTPKPGQHLVQVLAVALNPMDYKPAEVQFLHMVAVPKPATPGYDFVGRIVKVAKGTLASDLRDGDFNEGDLVFGAAGNPLAGGALAEYAAVNTREVAKVPQGVENQDAASIPMAGITAWQSLMPYSLKAGSRAFLNGGSGGVGRLAIQIAKSTGAHVTTSCSKANVELCKEMGADEVLDYTSTPLIKQLQDKAEAYPYDLVVDYVGSDFQLYWQSHTYTSSSASFVLVAFAPTLAFVKFRLRSFLPGFIGGGKRKLVVPTAVMDVKQISTIAEWLADGRVKSTVAETFTFDKVPEAYRLSKSGRAKGKIVVAIA